MNDKTPIWSPDVAARLAVLRAALTEQERDSLELEIPETPVSCYLGTETGGSMWLRITCDPHSVSTDDQAAAVSFAITATGYKVTVSQEAPSTVTGHLFDEMIQMLTEGHSPGDVGRTALKNWRDLLARPAGGVLGDKAIVGLFGELEVLETLLACGGEFEHWTGWNRTQQDFRLPRLAIEVKATTSTNYRRVQIHGLSQLDDPEDGSDLLLVLKRLIESPTGRSVPELIESIIRAGVSRAMLLERLSEVGYSEQHLAVYAIRRFLSMDVALRNIDSSHPRLVPSMLTSVNLSCIDKVDYELNLNGLADADIDLTLEELLRDYLEKS